MINKIILVIIFSISTLSVWAQEESQRQWPEFAKWYQWKVQSQLTEDQREVINYLEKANAIYNKALMTETVQSGSQYGYPNPKEAINIVKGYIKELNALRYPKVCNRYRVICLRLMQYIIDYHKLRLKHKEGSREFDINQAKSFIKQTKENLNSDQFNEYFKCMRNTGLLDDIEKEMANLGLIDRQKIDDFYGYIQEVDIGTMPKCPKCLGEMRRVPIVYGKIGEDRIYKDVKIVILPGGEMNYSGRPEFAYICDKDNKWYEEYPSHNKGKIIIRNWGWGFYNWRYGKKE